MDVTIALVSGAQAPDDLYSLREWLVEEDELRGRVHVVQRPPDPGELGSLAEALMIALGPGGTGAILASALIAWIRHRSGDLALKVGLPDGTSVEVRAKRLRGLSATDLSDQVEQLGRLLAGRFDESPDD